MNQTREDNWDSTFISANGFNGFRSHYNEVFKSESFERIFVIKGGPGTGKSSLMKKIRDRYKKENIRIESIYCSSDPSSLDGLILTREETKIGLVDGTAPHERDAIFPGVTDEIINLGEGLEHDELFGSKHEIRRLSNYKKIAYKNGYGLLRISGEAIRTYHDIYPCSDIYSWAVSFCSEFIREKSARLQRDEQLGFSSAFSRFGKSVLSENLPRKRDYILRGNGFTEYAATRALKSALRDNNVHFSAMPSPLSDDLIDIIITPEFKIYAHSMLRDSFIFDDGITPIPYSDKTIAATFIDLPDTAYKSGDSSASMLPSIYSQLLSDAARHFEEAASYHLALEKIYSTAMDFSVADRYYDYITSKIDSILRI